MLCSYDDLCYIICTLLRGRYCVIQHSCCTTNETVIIIVIIIIIIIGDWPVLSCLRCERVSELVVSQFPIRRRSSPSQLSGSWPYVTRAFFHWPHFLHSLSYAGFRGPVNRSLARKWLFFVHVVSSGNYRCREQKRKVKRLGLVVSGLNYIVENLCNFCRLQSDFWRSCRLWHCRY